MHLLLLTSKEFSIQCHLGSDKDLVDTSIRVHGTPRGVLCNLHCDCHDTNSRTLANQPKSSLLSSICECQDQILPTYVFDSGGVLPNIHAVLLPKKTAKVKGASGSVSQEF